MVSSAERIVEFERSIGEALGRAMNEQVKMSEPRLYTTTIDGKRCRAWEAFYAGKRYGGAVEQPVSDSRNGTHDEQVDVILRVHARRTIEAVKRERGDDG